MQNIVRTPTQSHIYVYALYFVICVSYAAFMYGAAHDVNGSSDPLDRIQQLLRVDRRIQLLLRVRPCLLSMRCSPDQIRELLRVDLHTIYRATKFDQNASVARPLPHPSSTPGKRKHRSNRKSPAHSSPATVRSNKHCGFPKTLSHNDIQQTCQGDISPHRQCNPEVRINGRTLMINKQYLQTLLSNIDQLPIGTVLNYFDDNIWHITTPETDTRIEQSDIPVVPNKGTTQTPSTPVNRNSQLPHIPKQPTESNRDLTPTSSSTTCNQPQLLAQHFDENYLKRSTSHHNRWFKNCAMILDYIEQQCHQPKPTDFVWTELDGERLPHLSNADVATLYIPMESRNMCGLTYNNDSYGFYDVYMIRPSKSVTRDVKPNLEVIVHGTWACDSNDFFNPMHGDTLSHRIQHIKNKARQEHKPYIVAVYRWSGNNDHDARNGGSDTLRSFLSGYRHNYDHVTIIGHSHGWNLVKCATIGTDCQPIDAIIMLAGPVRRHVPTDWVNARTIFHFYSQADVIQLLGATSYLNAVPRKERSILPSHIYQLLSKISEASERLMQALQNAHYIYPGCKEHSEKGPRVFNISTYINGSAPGHSDIRTIMPHIDPVVDRVHDQFKYHDHTTNLTLYYSSETFSLEVDHEGPGNDDEEPVFVDQLSLNEAEKFKR